LANGRLRAQIEIALEWLDIQRPEKNRHAAVRDPPCAPRPGLSQGRAQVLVLRELAENAPSQVHRCWPVGTVGVGAYVSAAPARCAQFNLHLQKFVEQVWAALWDQKEAIRDSAALVRAAAAAAVLRPAPMARVRRRCEPRCGWPRAVTKSGPARSSRASTRKRARCGGAVQRCGNSASSSVVACVRACTGAAHRA
jgi:hypothetical protein